MINPQPTSAIGGAPEVRSTAASVQLGEDDQPVSLLMLERLDLVVVVLTLFLALTAYQEPLTWEYGALAAVAGVLCGRFITAPNLRHVLTFGTAARFAMPRLLMEWGTIVGIMMFLGFAFDVSDWYSRKVLIAWFAATTVGLAAVQEFQIRVARWMNSRGALASKFVIVGVNAVGLELQKRLPSNAFCGFFDFRSDDRLLREEQSVSGVLRSEQLGDFVRRHSIASVYIALPIANAPRIREMLADLRDSTTSVYFVPDIFAFDLIQARVVDVNGMPALAVCDTPMRGTSAFSKRVMDLVLATLALVVLSPLMLGIAIAVRATSPGPAIFRQRRYGVDGSEIVVFKFRSMRVVEDGGQIRQASRDDPRVTRLGAFLRRTSLDELPQLWNVVEGKMSLVGPRPHAVAHNELYRRQINGYMVRHKVLPGITGWAQVHGLRGETDTNEKMAMRIRFDLEYLRNWSIGLDLRILAKTVLVVLRGNNAH